MATLYKNNIPYSTDNDAVKTWAVVQVSAAVTSAAIAVSQNSTMSLTVNGNLVGLFDGAPTAMTVLYEAFMGNGGTANSWDSFTVSTPVVGDVSPVALDMSNVITTATTLIISGHTWTDYGNRPLVVMYDSTNNPISSTSPTGSSDIAIPTGTSRIAITSRASSPLFTVVTEITPYVFVADRRPFAAINYATTTQSGSEITFGRGTAAYRKTPLSSASTADFEDAAQNGRVDWVTDNAAVAIGWGYERFSFANPAGWTSLSSTNADWPTLQGNNQPHFPPNAYTGMALTSAPIYAAKDSIVGAINWDTPFTVDGFSNSDTANKGSTNTTPGDQVKAWAAATQLCKDLIVAQGGTPEITAYIGFRPTWTDVNMTAQQKTQLGTSKPSSGPNPTNQWLGGVNSPGFCPEPGFDGATGTSQLASNYHAYFDEEVTGLRDNCGFTCIGLDTGARVWQNAEGMSNPNGVSFTNNYGTTTGSDNLIGVFNSYGIKSMYESCALDRWTHTINGTTYDPYKLVPMTGADAAYYSSASSWALGGSWWGYVGDGSLTEFNGTLSGWDNNGGIVFNKTQTDGGATIGDPALAGAGKLGTNTEVHVVWRWKSNEVTSIIEDYSWTKMKQILYDFRDAGLINSVGASVSGTIVDGNNLTVTAQMFYEYIISLSVPGDITTRPTDPVEVTRLIVERIEGVGTMDASTQGWLEANNSYTTLTGTGGFNPVTGNQYPRLRSSSSGTAIDVICDVDFASTADRDSFLAACDLDNLTCRLTITEGGVPIAVGLTEAYNTNSTGSTSGNQVRMKIDFNEWTGTPPETGSSALIWLGQAEGWELTSGVKIEFFEMI